MKIFLHEIVYKTLKMTNIKKNGILDREKETQQLIFKAQHYS